MPSFLHPALFWTLGLPTLGVVAIPVLIHLINMMRHRRIQWAAMEFLLLSQKKNRTWVMLKQLLLLLLRMAAVAAIVLLVAQPVLQNRWGNLLGGTRTHHIVLLDDSFSMSSRWENTDAFAEGKKVVRHIGAEAARQVHPQLFTLLRFSRVARFQRAAEPDLLKQSVGPEFAEKLSERLSKIAVTQTAAGPLPALRAVAQLLGAGDGERRVVYVVSDFCARQWGDATELRTELLRLDEAGAEIHLVDCVDRTRPNLAIAALKPAEGIHAAGVPWFMEVGVQNFGPATARNVSVILGEDGHGRPAVTFGGNPAGQNRHGAVPGPFSRCRLARDHRPAGERRGRGRQPSLLDDESAARRSGVAGRRRRGSPRRAISELGAFARRGGADRRSAADRDAPLLEPQTAGRLSGHQPGEHRPAGRHGGRGPGKVRCRRRRRGVFPRRATRRRSISTTSCIGMERGCSPCRWPGRPS